MCEGGEEELISTTEDAKFGAARLWRDTDPENQQKAKAVKDKTAKEKPAKPKPAAGKRSSKRASK